jgi:hypothetical protein
MVKNPLRIDPRSGKELVDVTGNTSRCQQAAHTIPTGSAACMDFCHKAGCLVDEEPDTHLELEPA